MRSMLRLAALIAISAVGSAATPAAPEAGLRTCPSHVAINGGACHLTDQGDVIGCYCCNSGESLEEACDMGRWNLNCATEQWTGGQC